MSTAFTKTISIDASPEKVWRVLTDPQRMREWMSDAEITIITDWTIEGPILIRGKLHGWNFENRGTVLAFDPGKKLRYNYWSRLFGLPDRPEHYTEIDFELAPGEGKTILAFSQFFATSYAHDQHAALYWTVTLDLLKKQAEKP